MTSLITVLLAFAGGGGSGGGGGGGGGGFSGGGSGSGGNGFSSFNFFVMLVVLVVACIVVIRRMVVQRAQQARIDSGLALAELSDTTWDRGTILAETREICLAYQRDWSRGDAEPMAAYMTPEYYQHAVLMLAALASAHRLNPVGNPQIAQAEVTSFLNPDGSASDSVDVQFTIVAQDCLVDLDTNEMLYDHPSARETETWTFKRAGEQWLLDAITPQTALGDAASSTLREFAESQGYFYALDWGTLLLPTHGQLFKHGSFDQSDINNHIIGEYQGHLIQLYSYSAKANAPLYIVGQAYLPKRYDDIVVRRRDGLLGDVHPGLDEVTTEWPDFDKQYQVLAANADEVTSLELLTPDYMAELHDTPYDISLEVVDNVVYLYTKADLSLEAYQVLLERLQKAFAHMER